MFSEHIPSKSGATGKADESP